MSKKRPHTNTTISLAPMTVDEALAALLKTPPPPIPADKVTGKAKRKKPKQGG